MWEYIVRRLTPAVAAAAFKLPCFSSSRRNSRFTAVVNFLRGLRANSGTPFGLPFGLGLDAGKDLLSCSVSDKGLSETASCVFWFIVVSSTALIHNLVYTR